MATTRIQLNKEIMKQEAQFVEVKQRLAEIDTELAALADDNFEPSTDLDKEVAAALERMTRREGLRRVRQGFDRQRKNYQAQLAELKAQAQELEDARLQAEYDACWKKTCDAIWAAYEEAYNWQQAATKITKPSHHGLTTADSALARLSNLLLTQGIATQTGGYGVRLSRIKTP